MKQKQQTAHVHMYQLMLLTAMSHLNNACTAILSGRKQIIAHTAVSESPGCSDEEGFINFRASHFEKQYFSSSSKHFLASLSIAALQSKTMKSLIGGEAYWTDPLFGPNGQAMLPSVQLFCLQIDFYSISYSTPVGNECRYRYVSLKNCDKITYFQNKSFWGRSGAS